MEPLICETVGRESTCNARLLSYIQPWVPRQAPLLLACFIFKGFSARKWRKNRKRGKNMENRKLRNYPSSQIDSLALLYVLSYSISYCTLILVPWLFLFFRIISFADRQKKESLILKMKRNKTYPDDVWTFAHAPQNGDTTLQHAHSLHK